MRWGRSKRAGSCKRVTVDRDWEGGFAWNPIRMESGRKSEDVISPRSRSPPYPSLPSACRSQSRNVTNAIWQRTGKSQANFLFPCLRKRPGSIKGPSCSSYTLLRYPFPMAMASSYHLRPVVDSPSPSTSTTTSSDRTPPPRNGQSHVNLLPPTSANRRPMSPTSIRDLDLSATRRAGDTTPRMWPVPPTGHELMALFPPAPPMNIISGPTSGFFQREERAFFAQAGKEIVRVKIEVDMPQHQDDVTHSGKSHLTRQNSRSSQYSPQSTTHPLGPGSGNFTSSPNVRNNHQATASPYPHESSRSSRQGPVPLAVQPVYPASQHPSSAPMPPPPLPPSHRPAYPIRSPTEDHSPHLHPPAGVHPVSGHGYPGNGNGMGPDEYRDEADDSWRTPMPHNQRRRAGKHTRRVVVK